MDLVGAHLVFVFDDVGVDLVQRRHAVELAEVQTGLLCQVGTHVLIADGWHTGDIRVIPRQERPSTVLHISPFVFHTELHLNIRKVTSLYH